MYAAQCLAEILGNTGLSDWYAGGPASIMTSLQRPCNWYPPGTWNPLAYYNRAVKADNTERTLIDSSSDVLITLGAMDPQSKRSASHVATVLEACTQQTYGVARYPEDVFYYTGAWSPGGNEALGPEPSWPQMSLWVAVYEILAGDMATALARLQWFVGISGKGYMPSGEAVSNVTKQPLPSSMCEPLTGSAFIMAALIYQGQYSLGVIPPVYNAGAAKTLSIGAGAIDTASEWTDVPYFIGPQKATASPAEGRIKRVYITNDYSTLYIRVDNVAGSFPAFDQNPLFALNVYSQDFADPQAPVTNLGIAGQSLRRPMTYFLERHSSDNAYNRRRTSGGVWSSEAPVQTAVEPQWDPATGRVEAVVPIQALANGVPWLGNAWGCIQIVLALYNTQTSTWQDSDALLVHYRLSTPDQNWIYGNIEQ